jgi:nondiscriminating aspartyl-tRNA synthetase
MINISGKIKNEIEIEGLNKYIGRTVTFHGSIYKIRHMSGFAFVILRGKRSLIQCIYSKEYTDYDITQLRENSCVLLTGEVIAESRSKSGYEVRIKQITTLSIPEEETPVVINNKEIAASLETILD